LTLSLNLTPFSFTHLVTPSNPLKLACSLACRPFMACQLPEIGLFRFHIIRERVGEATTVQTYG
jgi:hypothetical protein